MTKKLLLKSVVVITILLLQFNLHAQEIPPITLHVETAGTLSTMIAENRKYEITDLTLTGNLDSRDVRYIREMAGRDYEGKTTNGKLTNLNLAGANIVSYRQTIHKTKSDATDNQTCYYYYTYTSGSQSWTDYYYFHTEDNSITEYMFSDCNKLKTIILPTNLTFITNESSHIQGGAFYGCTSLTSIIIPENVISIGSNTFSGCTGLTRVTIGNSVTSIGNSAFDNCRGITSIIIGDNLASLNGLSFYYNLMEIIVSEKNQNYSTEDGILFDKTKGTIIKYPAKKLGSSYIIPNSVKSIENSAFSSCTGLTSITIPNDVTSIGDYAFSACSGLTNVIIESDITSIGNYTFSNCTGLISITIPESVTTIGISAFNGCTGLTKIHSRNPVPPSLNSYCFSGVNKTTCQLYVPKDSKNAYWLQWGFDNIFEEDASSITTISKDNITIQHTANGIAFEAKKQTFVSVCNLSGQIVSQSVIIGNMEIPLNKGLYVVRVNNESQKVIVK